MNKILKIVTLSLGLIIPTHFFSQVGNDAIGARSTAMGGVNTTLSDLWSANNNQAGLGFVTELAAGAYFENRFLLKETSYKAGAFVMPTKLGAFGVSVASFGFSDFVETKAGVSYGQRFSEKFSVGIQLNYLRTSLTQEFGSKNNVTGAIGLIGKLSKEFTLGVHVYNPTRNKLANFDNERVPTIMKLGLDYRFSDKVIFALETEKDIDFEAVVKAGIEYHVIEILYLRVGITTNPTSSSFGFGLIMNNFILEASSSYHQTLGITPGVSIIYKKQKSSVKSKSSI
ncbi:MAG: hypothetical protein CVT95_06635 [Bacteroidetes bacterium HGW-Bacteroidetes-12]|jgi:hypothetical protein|nr:MAG: hypothetical protein CVT95_06635 [Bacteroidetes bacterium HGW-Bacteroidetes-12]